MEPIRPERRIRAVKTLVAVLILLSFNACDEQGQNDGNGRPPVVADANNPCELLSPQQVQEAIGSKVNGEEEVGSHDHITRICSYKTGQPWASVSVSLKTDVSTDRFEKEMQRDPINTETVEDVGEGAFVHACASISVFSRDVLVSAGVQHLTTCDETSVVLEKLGTTIVKALEETSAS